MVTLLIEDRYKDDNNDCHWYTTYEVDYLNIRASIMGICPKEIAGGNIGNQLVSIRLDKNYNKAGKMFVKKYV